MVMLTQLADVLRDAGLSVKEVPGWQSRGKPWASNPDGFIAHHTGGGDNVSAAVALVRDGRANPPLAGPLSQFVLPPDGTWHIIAAGRSNHAGPGRWQGITSGNSEMFGCEAMNRGDGKDVWEPQQMHSYAAGAAALAKHFGFPALNVCGHKEWALPKGRKIDPTFDMPTFRELVADLMDHPARLTGQLLSVPTVDPVHAMLQRGSQGTDVLELQNRLRALGYKVAANGIFSWETDTRVQEFQRDRHLTVDGKVGPKTWAALMKGD